MTKLSDIPERPRRNKLRRGTMAERTHFAKQQARNAEKRWFNFAGDVHADVRDAIGENGRTA